MPFSPFPVPSAKLSTIAINAFGEPYDDRYQGCKVEFRPFTTTLISTMS